MAVKTSTIWANNEATFSGFAITKEFEPSYEWDAENGRFTDIQTTKDGVPVWSGEALIGQGWAGDVQPIQLRVVSKNKPSLRVDPAKIAMLFANADTANNVRTTNVPAPTATAGMSQPKHEAR